MYELLIQPVFGLFFSLACVKELEFVAGCRSCGVLFNVELLLRVEWAELQVGILLFLSLTGANKKEAQQECELAVSKFGFHHGFLFLEV